MQARGMAWTMRSGRQPGKRQRLGDTFGDTPTGSGSNEEGPTIRSR